MGSFKVTRISEGPVKPASATPDETLPLAWVDRYPTHRGLVESMHIFRSGADAAPAVIRDALAKALVYFYPLAGRIAEGEQPGAPAIRCTADGVYFAEAAADCSLEDVRYLERPLMLPKEDLVPYPGDDRWGVEPHNTIMMMQFPNPKIKPGPLPELPVLALDYIVLDFPTSYIDDLKKQYKAHSGKFCSGFDVLTAKLWQCRTRALNLEPEAEVKLCFFASVRHLLKLDRGYYGNSIFPVKMSAPSAKVLGSSIMEVVDMIRQAKDRMALGFSEVDYGFGPPVFAGPLVNNDFIASVVILKAPLPLDGTRMLASCVTKEHSEEFVRGMKEDLP
ncbi:hypothetical protein PR202_ga23224 [Eleusine coracana subsp. coracana]|uniref:Uncharacterized protein n=1 Tax=Eleusine coracana subsp. coracana TaxID=191504 RepID=A0AAV5D4P1_ELECO|nr:hypothetical protein PR202_ga23224 [Eleusine coracana subsp. coracana]